jgi:predicted transcriptional regulator
MEKQTVTFRIDADKVAALDELAEALDRDRTYLLNEAVASYLDIQQWQIQHIKASIKQADSGQFISHEDVKKMAAKWRHRR